MRSRINHGVVGQTITLWVILLVSPFINAQTKQITLEHKGGYVARFFVTWQEYGQSRDYESGNGKAVNWSKTLTLSQNASNITIKVEALNVFTYGSACSKNVGSSSGTFTAEGLLGNVSCDWSSDDLSASSGQATSKANINEILTGGNTNLHIAVKNRDRNQVTTLIRDGITHLETQNMRGYTPLHEAIQLKSNEMVEVLLNSGANVYQANKQGQTPLYMSVNLGTTDIVQTLFASGVSADSDSQAMNRLLTKRDSKMASLFLQNGADANAVLDGALKTNNAEIIELAILEGGAIPTIEVFKKAVDTRKFQMAESFLDNPMSNIDPIQALDYVILKNAKTLVPKALEKGGNPQSALSYAVKNKDINLANDAISLYGADANAVLGEVLRTNQVQMFDVLLNNGVDPNVALSQALASNNIFFTNKAIESGAITSSGQVAQAATQGKNDVLKILIENGRGNPNDGMTPAIMAGKYQTVEYLVQSGATATSDQIAKLAEQGQNNILKLLIEDGQADPNDGLRAAMGAAQYTTAEMLIQAGADADGIVKTAVEKKQKSLLVTALDAGADPAPGLSAAVAMGSVDYTKLLIDSGASTITNDHMSTAAKLKKTELVKILLQAGGKPQDGLRAAVESNSPEIVALLLKSGAKGNDNTLLKKSVAFNNVALTKLLVEAGANPEVGVEDAVIKAPGLLLYFSTLGIDLSNQRYLDTAVNIGNAQTAKILIENGCDPEHINGSGETYLHYAAKKGNQPMASLLIGKGTDVNAVDSSNNTALHLAVKAGRKNHEMVSMLINSGANVNAKDGSGQIALSFAKGSKTKKALKKAGED